MAYHNGSGTSPMPLGSEQQWTGIDALLNALQASEAQSQANLSSTGASGSRADPSSSTSSAPSAQDQPAHGILDQAALQHILNNPSLLSTVLSMLPAHILPSASPHETVTRSGRPSRPPVLQEDQLLAQLQGIWHGLGLDPAALSSGGTDKHAANGSTQQPDFSFSSADGFTLDPQLAGGAQTFAPAQGQMDVGETDWWWTMQEEGEEDDPTYVPPADNTTPSNGGAFTFSPAGEGEFLSSIGLNPDGTTPGGSGNVDVAHDMTSALYASPAATSLMELAASHTPGSFGQAVPVTGLHPSSAHAGLSPSLTVPATRDDPPTGRATRGRKKVRVEEPPATEKGKGASKEASVAGTSVGGSDDDDDGTSTVGAPGVDNGLTAAGKKRRRVVLTKEESAARRRARNKASALESRMRAKNHTASLETEVAELKSKVAELEKELERTRKELHNARTAKQSFAPNTHVYYNTPNIYDPVHAVPGVEAPQHPFAQLPPTPAKRKPGRPKKKVGSTSVAAHSGASSTGPGTLAGEQTEGGSPAPPPKLAAASLNEDGEEEEAQFTDGAESSSGGEDDDEDDMDDPEDTDFQDGVAVRSAGADPSSPNSQATVVAVGGSNRTATASTAGHPSSIPAAPDPASTSDVSDSSGDDEDPSSDLEKEDSDFDPTEDLYLPIRDVPFPGPPPDSPPKPPPPVGALASPAQPTNAQSPLANVDKTEVVDLLKQLLAKMGGSS